MTESTQALYNEAKKLSPTERLALVEEILDGLDHPDPEMDALWAREAEDCLAAYRRGEIQGVPLAEVLARCRRALTCGCSARLNASLTRP